MTGRGIPRKPATPAQIAKLRALGYAKLSHVYSAKEADRLIEKLGGDTTPPPAPESLSLMSEQQPSPPAPVLLTAWQKGETLLDHQGYTVLPMAHAQDGYEVQGGTEVYHVCVDRNAAAFGCSCPDGIQRGDKRPCKHFLGVLVQLWRWAEADPEGDFTEYLDWAGVTALRAGAGKSIGEGVAQV